MTKFGNYQWLPFVCACSVACGTPSLDGAPCPCANGWTCCAEEKVCRRACSTSSIAIVLEASVDQEAHVGLRWALGEDDSTRGEAPGSYEVLRDGERIAEVLAAPERN